MGLCRLLWLGALWGCAAEAVVLAAACSSMDPFSRPSRMAITDDAEYVKKLRRSLESRRRFDGGHASEPLAVLRLFYHWAGNYACAGADAGSDEGRTRGWGHSCARLAREAAIVPFRMQQLIARVADLSKRLLRIPMPGGAPVASKAARDVEALARLVQPGAHGGGAPPPPPSALFGARAPLLKLLLAAALGERVLVGRRFMDQLRGPPKLKGPPRSEPPAARQAGGGGEGEDERAEVSAEGGAAGEEASEDGETQADEGEHEEGEDLEGDDESDIGWGGVEDDSQERSDALPWHESRNAMLDAVNALPVRGARVWQSALVVRLANKGKGSVPMGALPFKEVVGVVERLCGERPKLLARPSPARDAQYAAVAFRMEERPEPMRDSCVPDASPAVLAGATVDASLCFAFSGGRGVFNVGGTVASRPTSPYLLSFFLPQRFSGEEEEKQKQTRASLDVFGPVGFPCHVLTGDDFALAASGLQITESGTSVRAEGATVLPAAQLAYCLATLQPDRTPLAVRIGRGPQGDGAQGEEAHVVALRVNGWEVSLTGGRGQGLPVRPLLAALAEVRAGVRAALCAEGDGWAPDREEFGGGDDPKEDGVVSERRQLKRKRQTYVPAIDPRQAVEALIEVVEAGAPRSEATRPGAKQLGGGRARPPRLPWRDVVLEGEPEGRLDSLRPLRVSEVEKQEVATSNGAAKKQMPFTCPVCSEGFKTWKLCRDHLKRSGHLTLSGPSRSGWRELVESRCRTDGRYAYAV
ncbi:unnamed protein product [Prorocentrum cordatum]|uniref:C2H2-type domain-containing protein n=1 Tax=Prorocentrum cordatum TaxID=2364126 RepID=A0ABN9XWQ2_9DINO|nr:unnamed protein product [Polarella glacialis]